MKIRIPCAILMSYKRLYSSDFTGIMKTLSIRLRTFFTETSRLFKEEFLKLLNDYVEARKNKKGRQRILDYLVEKGFTMPSFAIYEAEKAAGVLGDLGLDRPVINSQSLLIVFNLPKPLSHFWWKGGVEADDGLAVVVGPDITEGGLFYRQLMPVV